MLFYSFSLQAVLVTLFLICIGSFAGPCMPCEVSNRRHTPWDLLPPSRRGVYSPKITNPTIDTVWRAGSDVIVTWDLRDMPDKTSNSEGTLLLGYFEEGSQSEHLNTDHPLASNFDIKNGFVELKCPKVESRKNYFVVLLGDSGNRSPTFPIEGSV